MVNRKDTTLLASLGLGLVLLVSLIPRWLYVPKNALSYDEGHLLMFGSLARQGYTPYTEIFVGQPPLALLTFQWGATLFGDTPGVRYLMVIYSLFGVLAVFLLVKSQATASPALAALLAALLFSFGPRYFFLSVSLPVEAPSLAFALLSLALIGIYRTRPWPGWLMLSGVAFALSLALKIFVVFLPLIIGLQALTIVLGTEQKDSPCGKRRFLQKLTYTRLLKMAAIWLAGFLVVLGVLLLLFDPAAMYRGAILFRLARRDIALVGAEGPQQNLLILGKEIIQYIPLAIGALLGLLLMGRRGLRQAWIWLVWLVMALLFLLLHVPLRPRHSVLLLPPLAALSGMAIASLIAIVFQQLKRPQSVWLTTLILGASIGWIFVGPLRALASPPRRHPFDERHTERLSAVAFIREHTAPDDCLVTEDQRFAFQADRLVPPFLSETSESRLITGWLTAEQIIEIAEREDCAALIYQRDDFDEFVPELRQAAMSLYSLRLEFSHPEKSDATTVYAFKMNTNQAPSRIVNHSLSGQVTLEGVDVTPSSLQAGQEVSISTYWRAQRKMDRDYKIFIHVKDAQGRVVATFDHYPFESSPDYMIFDTSLNSRYLEGQVVEDFANYPATGLIPTRLWIPGNTLKETITITWPETISPGTYTLTVGMYDESTMERLAVQNGLSGSDKDPFAVANIQIVD